MVALVQMSRSTVVLVARGVCFRLVLTSLWCAGEGKLCYPDERVSCTPGDRYGPVLSFTAIVFHYTVTGTTI